MCATPTCNTATAIPATVLYCRALQPGSSPALCRTPPIAGTPSLNQSNRCSENDGWNPGTSSRSGCYGRHPPEGGYTGQLEISSPARCSGNQDSHANTLAGGSSILGSNFVLYTMWTFTNQHTMHCRIRYRSCAIRSVVIGVSHLALK